MSFPNTKLILDTIKGLRRINTDRSNRIADELEKTIIDAVDYASEVLERYYKRGGL